MAPATKATTFATYCDPSLPIAKLNTPQYESLMQERHEAVEWNRILTAVKVVRFEDEDEFEEVKARSTKKSDIGIVFTPNKKARRRTWSGKVIGVFNQSDGQSQTKRCAYWQFSSTRYLAGPRGNRQSWRHLDEVGRSASRAPDNKPGQRDEREYRE
jgi:hypothetical protein